MHKIFSYIKNLVKNNEKASALVIIIAISLFFYGMFSSSSNAEETIKVVKGDIIQTVKVTGNVKAVSTAGMSFEKSAPVVYLGVKVGDSVYVGKVLATVSSGDEQANLMQTRASLDNANAVLDQLKAGARTEELAIKEQAVTGASNNLDIAYSSLPDSIHNADAVTSDVVKNKLAGLFTSNSSTYRLSFSSCDQSLQSLTETKRTTLETDLVNFQKEASLITLMSSIDQIDKTFALAYDVTTETNDLVSSVSNILLSSCIVSNTAYDNYRTTLSTVRTSMNTLFTDITNKRTALISAKNNLGVANRDYDLTKAGTDPNKIRAQEAVVAESQAKLKSAEVQLAKTQIVAPFDGVVTEVSLTRGEVASMQTSAIKIISANDFEIEAKVPEIDIAKVKVGNPVNITLDTYGTSVIFEGVVSRVNPSSETSDNVPMYKVVVSFKKKDDRIKSGMTANLSIVTQSKQGVMVLPIRFVKTNGTDVGVVSLKTGTSTEDRNVKVGTLGENGNLEIVEGLMVGDEVIAIQPGVRSAQKQN